MLKYCIFSLLIFGLTFGNSMSSFEYGSNFPSSEAQISSKYFNLHPNKATPIFIPENSLQNFQQNHLQNRNSHSKKKSDNSPVLQTSIDPRLGGIGSLLQTKLNEQASKPGPDNINELFATTLKKYDVKRYLLRKILGPNHENDEADGGFFSNQHLKRHGTAGVAGKLLGELIGIKIRESIDKLGKRFGEIAKDFTARNIVNAGNSFARIIKMSRY